MNVIDKLIEDIKKHGKKVKSRLGDVIELESVVLNNINIVNTYKKKLEDYDFYDKISLNKRLNFIQPIEDGIQLTFNKVVDYMICNKDSRRSVFYLSEFWTDEEIACIPVIHFLIRENKLNLHVFARSIDVFNKLMNDIYMLNYIANKFIERYNIVQASGKYHNYDNIPLEFGGVMSMYISSAHIYERDL